MLARFLAEEDSDHYVAGHSELASKAKLRELLASLNGAGRDSAP